MNPILAILLSPRVTSPARKVLLSAGSIAIVKYVPNVELQAGLLLLLGAILQAWSEYDDQRIKAASASKAAATVADAILKEQNP